MATILTHRGFTVAMPEHGSVDGFIEHPLTDALYDRVRVGRDFDTDFQFLTEVVHTAKQTLFTRGVLSLALQLRVPASRRVHAFALDTLRYLSGQPRRMSLENYRDLLAFHPKERASLDYLSIVRSEGLDWAFSTPASHIVATWLAKDDGLTDLVTTMQLVAGSLPDNWADLSEAID